MSQTTDHVLVRIAEIDSGTFPLLKFTLLRTNEVDADLHVLANELLAEEFAGLVRIIRLLRI